MGRIRNKFEQSMEAQLSRAPLRNPRIVKNILPQADRFPTGFTPDATGLATQFTRQSPAGVKNGRLRVESLTAGRRYYKTTGVSVTAGLWYCFSFKLNEISYSGGTIGLGLVRGSGATIDRGTTTITAAQMTAGGPGRYGIIFRASSTGTIELRLGTGTTASASGQVLDFEDLMLEELSTLQGLAPSEYVYPKYEAAFNYENPFYIDSNGKIIDSNTRYYFGVKPYSNILMIGDSRTDENTDLGGRLAILLDGISSVTWSALGGTKFSQYLQGTTNQGVALSFDSMLNLTAMTRAWSTNGDEEIFDYLYEGALRFDTVILSDFGYNSIVTYIASAMTSAEAVALIMTEFDTFVKKVKSFGYKLIVTDNNPVGGLSGVSPDTVAGIKLLNSEYIAYCNKHGIPYVSFYYDLEDPLVADAMLAANTTDGLHFTTTGADIAAGKIKNVIDILRG